MAKLTLLDLAKRTGNAPEIGIVEATTQNNALLSLIPFRGINGVSYRFGRRVGLPAVAFKGINQGVSVTKSKVDQILIETKDVGGRSEVDKLLAERDPRGINVMRSEEDAGFSASMGNLFNLKFYYGSTKTTSGLEFDGVTSILNALSFATVTDAGGDSANVQTSAYFIAFGDANGQMGRLKGVEGLLGNGKNITAIDMGLQYVDDADSKKYLAYTTEFEFAPGLAIYDTRSVGRICNLDAGSPLTVTLINAMLVQMYPYVPSAIFVNKAQYLVLQGLKVSALDYYNSDTDLFKRVLSFNGIPIFIDDNITQTEAVVS